MVKDSRFIVEGQENPFNITTEIVQGNSATIDYKEVLKERGLKKVQLVIMHPPYYDIIKFSSNDEDLSNAADVEDFLDKMEKIVRNTALVLEDGRYMCLVIGDKYTGGEWLPLGFQAMPEGSGYRVLQTEEHSGEEFSGNKRKKKPEGTMALQGNSGRLLCF